MKNGDGIVSIFILMERIWFKMMITVGILTVSDRSALGERADLTGPAIRSLVEAQKWLVKMMEITPDEFSIIREKLINWADLGDVNIILTAGGTGFSPRDITPEATLAVIERSAPGLAEAMRSASLQITPHAVLSRSVAGIRKRTLIINLPGSPKGAVQNLEVILPALPHAVQLLTEDSNAEAGH